MRIITKRNFAIDAKDKLYQLMQWNEMPLISTHTRVSLPIIMRMYRKMLINVPFKGIHVVDNVLIDGHHRYLASLLANYTLDQLPGIRSSAKRNIDWTWVDLEDDDWDSILDIDKFNRQDARCMGLSLDGFLEKMWNS